MTYVVSSIVIYVVVCICCLNSIETRTKYVMGVHSSIFHCNGFILLYLYAGMFRFSLLLLFFVSLSICTAILQNGLFSFFIQYLYSKDFLCGCRRFNKIQKSRTYNSLVHWREENLTSYNLENKVFENSYTHTQYSGTKLCNRVYSVAMMKCNIIGRKKHERQRKLLLREPNR